MTLSRNWLPAASGTDPITITLSGVPPETYQLLTEGAVAVRWNGQLLPLQSSSTGATQLQFTVPAAMRTPGLTEFTLWNAQTQEPLPYSGWIAVIIPTAAEVFEGNPDDDRLVAAVAGDGTASGTGGQITVYQISTGLAAQTIPVPAGQRVLTFTPDTSYAWIAENEAQGLVARLNLATGATDEAIQFAIGTPPYSLSAAVDANTGVLMLSVQGSGAKGTWAYLNGTQLPDAAPANSILPFGTDDQGRYLMWNGQACHVDPAAGFDNCGAFAPGINGPISLIWKNKGFTGSSIVDLTTGNVLLNLEDGGYTANYLPASNRLLLNYYGTMTVLDGDTLETYANVGSELLNSEEPPRRIFAPDWILMATTGSTPTGSATHGILIGQMPQLGPAPVIFPGGVVNAATGQGGPISAGEIVSLYGQNLGPTAGAGPVLSSETQLATQVSDTQVFFDGVPGTMLYTGSGQINVVAPETLQSSDSVSIQVVRYQIPSLRAASTVGPWAPGMFGYLVNGQMYAAALNAGNVVQGPLTPLTRGMPAVFYVTGVGLPPGETADTVASRAEQVATAPSVSIGGIPATVFYAGVSPTLTVGLTQLNVIVPPNAPTGSAVEVVVSAGNQNQGNVWVAVQ